MRVYLFACVRLMYAGVRVCVSEWVSESATDFRFRCLAIQVQKLHTYVRMLIFCCLACSVGYFEEIYISPAGNSAQIYIFHLKTSSVQENPHFLVIV